MGKLVWLASYPKSGNTWIRAFLANLAADRTTPLPLAELSRYCRDDAEPEPFAALSGRPTTDLDVAAICALRERVQLQLAANATGTLFVKTHSLLGSFDGHRLHNREVTAGAVYIVRNPLDVAVSMTHHFGLSADAAIDMLNSSDAATLNDRLFVTQILGSWSEHVSSWTAVPGAGLLVLRYEDLLEKTFKNFMKLAQFVGISDRGRVERAIRCASFASLSKQEKLTGFNEAVSPDKPFFHVGRARQWRDVLTRSQIDRIVDAHRAQMTKFKYLPGKG
jgi:hypothetical protein